MYVLQFDGLYREIAEQSGGGHHAGFMCYGWLIYQRGKLLARGLGVFARRKYAASNIAEYLALIEGLEALADLNIGDAHVEIRGDAKCVLDQMAGRANVTSLPTRSIYRRAKKLARPFPHLDWHWVPRCENHAADLLTRRALRQMRAVPDSYHAALENLAHSVKGKATRLWPVLDLRVVSSQKEGMVMFLDC